MTEPEQICQEQRDLVKTMVKEISEAKSFYYIAKLMQKGRKRVDTNPVIRMLNSGRCEKWEFDMLVTMHADVSHETRQNADNNETSVTQSHVT